MYPTYELLTLLPAGTLLSLNGYSEDLTLTWVGIDNDGNAVVIENGFEEVYGSEFITGKHWNISYLESVNKPVPAPVIAPDSASYTVSSEAAHFVFTDLLEATLFLIAVRNSEQRLMSEADKAEAKSAFSMYDADNYLVPRSTMQPVIEKARQEARRVLYLLRSF